MVGSRGSTHGGNNNDHSLEHESEGPLTPRTRRIVRRFEHLLGESVHNALDKINDNLAALRTRVEHLERWSPPATTTHDEPRVEDPPAHRTPPAACSWADEVEEEGIVNLILPKASL